MRLAFALALLVVWTSSRSAGQIPVPLVGIWTSEIATARAGSSRTNVYLGADGVGAIVSGSPPIGFKIVATFDSKTSTVEFDAYEGDKRGFHGQLRYDPEGKTLEFVTHKEVLRKSSNVFTADDKKAIGLQ